MRRFILFILMLLATAAAPAVAMQPMPDRPAVVSAVSPDGAAVNLTDASMQVVCRDAGRDAVCDWTATYQLQVEAPATVRFRMWGYRINAPSVALDGAQIGARSALERTVTPERYERAGPPESLRSDFVWDVELNGTHTMVVTGTATPPATRDSMIFDGLKTRHLLLADSGLPGQVMMWVDSTDLEQWGGAARMSTDFQAPSDWEVHEYPAPDADPATLTADEADVKRYSSRVPPPGLRPGGPYLALGASFDGDFTGRAGYEFGLGLWSFAGVSVASDFNRRHTFSVTATAAFAGFSCLLPSAGLGAGPVLLLGDDTTVGARAELDVSYPFVGGLLVVDWFPGLDNAWQLAAFGRIGF